MCLINQINIKPCVAQEDIKVIKLLKNQKDGSYVTPFQNVSVTLNSTLCAEGDTDITVTGCDGYRKEIGGGYVHAKLRMSPYDKDNDIVGVVAYISKGTEYFVDIYVSEVCAKQLLITDEFVDLETFALTKEELLAAVKTFVGNLMPTEMVTPGWLFTADKQFIHPLECTDDMDIIGVVANTNDNWMPTTVFSLDEIKLSWSKAIEYCKTYKTNGTNEGDWVLPDEVTLQRIFANHIMAINLALALTDKTPLHTYYWASAEYSSTIAWYCGTYYAGLGLSTKCLSNYVRPSFAIDVE